MARAGLSTRIFLTVLVVSISSLGVTALVSVAAMRNLNTSVTMATLSATARILANQFAINPDIRQDQPDMTVTDALCDQAAAGTDTRITLVAPDGRVLGDSAHDPAGMENHSMRPEIAGALAGTVGTSFRASPTLTMDMAYAAAPVVVDGKIVAALRVAAGAPDLDTRLSPFIGSIVLVAGLAAIAIGLISVRIGAGLSRPVLSLAETAMEWSAGKLDCRVRLPDDPELGPLAETMNGMAAELASRIVTTETQRSELEAILDAMEEAVLSTDADLVIRTANRAATGLIAGRAGRAGTRAGRDTLQAGGDGAPAGAGDPGTGSTGSDGTAAARSVPGQIEGLSVLEASGMVALDDIARRCVATGTAQEAETVMYGQSIRHLMVMAAPKPAADGRTGVVLVLADITRLKRLERVRKDFVANVSHELRTPITLIKGFAETLASVDDRDEARRFLAIIQRHADRMAAIIEDLLTLARLEGPERGPLATGPVQAGQVLGRAVESLGDKPASRTVTISVVNGHGLVAAANEGLLEQALVNLLDNAVKYGPPGGTVTATVVRDGAFVRFVIHDDGPGIPQADLPRLFERFYRVDRARSRDLGGTGLGLAIVKHIALAHGGDAAVSSLPGQGSSFCIRVPLWTDDRTQTAPPDVSTAPDRT